MCSPAPGEKILPKTITQRIELFGAPETRGQIENVTSEFFAAFQYVPPLSDQDLGNEYTTRHLD